MAVEVEESLQRLAGMKGAVGGIVMTMDGEVIRSTLNTTTTAQVTDMMISLIQVAKIKLSNSDQGSDLEMLRLRTNKYQFVLVPDAQFLLVMVLNPWIVQKSSKSFLDDLTDCITIPDNWSLKERIANWIMWREELILELEELLKGKK